MLTIILSSLVLALSMATPITYTPWTPVRNVDVTITNAGQGLVRLSVSALSPPELITGVDCSNRPSLGQLPDWAWPAVGTFPTLTLKLGASLYAQVVVWNTGEVVLWPATFTGTWPVNKTVGWDAFELYYYTDLPQNSYSLESTPPFGPVLGDMDSNRTVYGTLLEDRVVLALKVNQFYGPNGALLTAFVLSSLPLELRPRRPLPSLPIGVIGLGCGSMGVGYLSLQPNGEIHFLAKAPTNADCTTSLLGLTMISWTRDSSLC